MRSLPAVVVEHFRSPRNEGPLAGADGAGQVEGRREDSLLRLSLRLAPDGTIAAAGFEVEGDRSCRVGLSLLTCLLPGRTPEEAAALGPEAVGEAYALAPENLPMMVLPLEALRAAVADLRGQPSPYLDEGRLVCTCLHVREGRIRRAIREQDVRDVEGVQRWTRACTGCRSCHTDVLRLVTEARRPRR